MKKHPRYSRRQPGSPSNPSQPVAQQYSGYPPQGEYYQPYDWRYATQSPRPPHDPSAIYMRLTRRRLHRFPL